MPGLRGKEKDRRPGDILAEVEALVAEGVIEVTLLGQNVNAYGVEFGDRQAFAQAAARLRRHRGAGAGAVHLARTRRDFTDDVIEAMAETPNVMPQLHMPLQSGSDRVLKAMRRSYRQERYLGIIERVRAAMPDAAITTDIIVGFPGETEDDFAADPRRRARGAVRRAPSPSSTPCAPAPRPPTMRDQVPKAVVQERYERLVALVRTRSPGRRTRRWSAARVEVLVAEGEGRKDAATAPAVRPRPRQPAGALRPPADADRCAPATSSPSRSPTPRRTTWSPTARARRSAAPAPATPGRRRTAAAAAEPAGVMLGLPTVGVPAPRPAPAGACGCD